MASPGASYRLCAGHGACNWLVDAPSADTLCLSCRHNRTIPDPSVEANVLAWRRIQRAKLRLFYSLLRLGLPLQTKAENEQTLAEADDAIMTRDRRPTAKRAS